VRDAFLLAGKKEALEIERISKNCNYKSAVSVRNGKQRQLRDIDSDHAFVHLDSSATSQLSLSSSGKCGEACFWKPFYREEEDEPGANTWRGFFSYVKIPQHSSFRWPDTSEQ